MTLLAQLPAPEGFDTLLALSLCLPLGRFSPLLLLGLLPVFIPIGRLRYCRP